MTSHNKNIGRIGEKAVANHLKHKGFKLLDTNYLKKWGEIDVIMQKGETVHFIEVKTVSREMSKYEGPSVTHETYRPEENVTSHKIRKLYRAIESWMTERHYDGEWQIDVASVYLDPKTKIGKVEIIENIILG